MSHSLRHLNKFWNVSHFCFLVTLGRIFLKQHFVASFWSHAGFWSCISCSLCFPLHPGLHNRLNRDPTGGQWEPRIHSSGPRATTCCFSGQYDWRHTIMLFLSFRHQLLLTLILIILSYFMSQHCFLEIQVLTICGCSKFGCTLAKVIKDVNVCRGPVSHFTLCYWNRSFSSLISINLYYPSGKYGWQAAWLQSNTTAIIYTLRSFKTELCFSFLILPPASVLSVIFPAFFTCPLSLF